MITEYNPAFNDYIRIPLQLKFERDDMFETLIAPARADRSLTTLIQQLLNAYYTSQTVRDIVAQQSMGFTDIDLLAKQVDKVSKAHNTTRMLASMMADDIQDAQDGLYAKQTSENVSSKGTVVGVGSDAVMTMLQEIAAQVGNLSARMNQMEITQQANVNTLATTQAQTQEQRQGTAQPINVSVAMPIPQTNTVNKNTDVTKPTTTKQIVSQTNGFAKLATSMVNLG